MDTSISNTIIVTWPSPDQFLPDHALQLFSRDTEGGVTVRFVSVVLCACLNGGTCLKDNRVLNRARFDDNGHYKWACNCSDFYGGSSCETDMRGCGNFSTCPDPSMCRDDPTLPSGYACDQCSDGFELVDNKCSGKRAVWHDFQTILLPAIRSSWTEWKSCYYYYCCLQMWMSVVELIRVGPMKCAGTLKGVSSATVPQGIQTDLAGCAKVRQIHRIIFHTMLTSLC